MTRHSGYLSRARSHRGARHGAILTLLALCSLWAPRAAHADTAQDADALFEAGLEKMRAEDYEAACPMLERSYAMDAAPGALFTLAECHAAWGKVATAVQRYQEFVDILNAMQAGARKRYDERRGVALEKMAQLSPTIPDVRVVVPETAPKGLIVKQDGQVVEVTRYGVSRPLDPGRHVFTAELDANVVFEQAVDLAAGDHAQVVVEPSPRPQPTSGDALAQAPGESRRDGFARSPALWMKIGIGLGAAGLAAGIAAGGIAFGKKGTIDDHCDGSRCDAKGMDAATAGQRAAAISTAGFAVALVG
ncbi:MAG TPA: hypothetical protein VI299_14640, partial [Polyangiales bacterium]